MPRIRHPERTRRWQKTVGRFGDILGKNCATDGDPMKRTWTIIGVGDVRRSFQWYQALLGQPISAPAHNYFGQILDADGTVLLCLH